jgi:glycine hydroxymethyltransferase
MVSVSELIRRQENFRRNVLALQPSENTIPRKALRALSSDFEQRYSLVIDSIFRDQKIHNAYAGTKHSEALVEEVERLSRKAFKSDFADVRPIAGHLAAMQVLGSLLKKGEKFLYVPMSRGGYDGYTPPFLPALLGIEGREIPMNGWKIDYEKLSKVKGHFKAVILGASLFLHPYDMKRVKELFPDSLILYDASHALGLLATGTFQKDFNEADVIYGSTHKNFPGPQGGLIVGKKEVEQSVRSNPIWNYYDNFHLSRISALGISLEYLSESNYGKRCLDNRRKLVESLEDRKVKLANRPEVSESAMFLLDYKNIPEISRKLESANILVDSIGRVGTNEITMRGLGPKHMDIVGEALEEGLGSNITSAKKTVRELLTLMTWP